MKSRNLLAAAVLLAALSGIVWWANKHPQSDTSTTTDKSVKLVNIPADQLQQIEIKKKNAPTIDVKREGSAWKIVSPDSFAADQDAVSSLLSSAAPLNADSVIADNSAPAAQYGLSNPSLTVTLSRKDGKTDRIVFGDEVPAGSLVYAQHQSDPKIYAVSSSVKTSFDKTENDLRDKKLLTFSSEKLTSVELDNPKTSVTLGKNNQGDWQITKPGPFRADSFQVDELVRKLQDARMELGNGADDQKKNDPAFAAGQLVSIVRVTDASGTKTLQVRKNKDTFYAKSSVVPGVYKVAGDLGTALTKSLDDLRNHKLFDFGFNDPNKLEYHNGASNTVYQKSGQDWKSDGKTMDAGSIQAVIDQLRDLSATAFPSSGFTTPNIEITVASNGGKRIEKVAFAKAGENYLGKREGEPALYTVPAKNIDDLVKAFSAVKPAPPKKK
jgi:hypothetical protein